MAANRVNTALGGGGDGFLSPPQKRQSDPEKSVYTRKRNLPDPAPGSGEPG